MNNVKLLMLMLIPLVLVSQEVEEVVVTANKKEQTLQDIPMNISVISEESLDERGITNPEDYLRTLAGVSTPGGSDYYTFRGLNTSTSQRSSGTSTTYVDEVSGSLMGLFDVERVEVLRGPQGTLYGSNAIGGTIRYITNKPDSSGAYGKVRVGYGSKRLASDPETTIEAMYNLPISDSLALRAVYSQIVSPGIYKNIQTGNTVGEVFDVHAQTFDNLGYNKSRMNACGYSLGSTFSPNWMDWPMLYTGNPYKIVPGNIFFMHMILMDSENNLAMNLGETYLVTENGNERLGKQKLDLVNL